MVRLVTFVLLFGAALVGTTGCDLVGATCDNPGTSEDCGDDQLCVFFDDETQICLRTCESTKDDCAEGEVWREVDNTDGLRTCQTGPLPGDPAVDPELVP